MNTWATGGWAGGGLPAIGGWAGGGPPAIGGWAGGGPSAIGGWQSSSYYSKPRHSQPSSISRWLSLKRPHQPFGRELVAVRVDSNRIITLH